MLSVMLTYENYGMACPQILVNVMVTDQTSREVNKKPLAKALLKVCKVFTSMNAHMRRDPGDDYLSPSGVMNHKSQI